MKKLFVLILCFTALLSMVACSTNTQVSIADTDTVIVGAGISGLTSAYWLNEAGKDFILLEKEDQVGGKAKTGFHDGFHYARGTEYIGKPEGALASMVKKLDIKLKEIPSPMDIHYIKHQKYYGTPGLVAHLINESSIAEFNRFVDEVMTVYNQYDELPYYRPYGAIASLDQMTAAQWFKEKNFSQVYYDTYNVTSKGLFGANLEEVSALNMIPEIAFDFGRKLTVSKEEYNEMKNYIPSKSLHGSEAYTFQEGIAALPMAIYHKLESKVRLSSFVSKVDKKDDLYYVTYTDTKTSETQVIKANNVIIAVPAPAVPLMAKALLSKEELETIENIPYASYVTAALYTDEYIINEAFDIAVEDNMFFTDVYDSTWVQRSFDNNVTNKKNSVLSVYIAPMSYKDKNLNEIPEEEILKNIYQEFDKYDDFKKIKDHVTGHDIFYIKYAYPVMIPGAYERLQKLHNNMNGSLQLAGDYMVYPTVEGAIQSGVIAAEKIMSVDH